MRNREQDDVELVSDDGRAIGSTSVADAHQPPGREHRAFSVLLVDGDGRLLLQRRAADKTRFALRWANTCCGHPTPGQDVAAAARRRLAEELGLEAPPLTEVGVYRYRAEDAAAGRVEHEFDHVLTGRIDASAPLRPDPAEVAETRWLTAHQIAAALATDPDDYAPWLAGVLDVWARRT